MIEWLRKNKDYISIRAINNHLNEKYGMPNSTLVKAISCDQKLPKKWEEPLRLFVEELTCTDGVGKEKKPSRANDGSTY